MARILFAWELGANLGHLGALVTLAKALRSRGHEAMFAVRDLAASATVAAPESLVGVGAVS